MTFFFPMRIFTFFSLVTRKPSPLRNLSNAASQIYILWELLRHLLHLITWHPSTHSLNRKVNESSSSSLSLEVSYLMTMQRWGQGSFSLDAPYMSLCYLTWKWLIDIHARWVWDWQTNPSKKTVAISSSLLLRLPAFALARKHASSPIYCNN